MNTQPPTSDTEDSASSNASTTTDSSLPAPPPPAGAEEGQAAAATDTSGEPTHPAKSPGPLAGLRGRVRESAQPARPPEHRPHHRPKGPRRDRPAAPEAKAAAAAVTESSGKEASTGVPIAEVAPVPSKEKIPTPSRRDAFTPEMEAELYEALGGVSLEQVVTGNAADAASQMLELDTRMRAGVVRIHGDNVFFGLSGRVEGVCSIRQFKHPPSVGDHMDIVLKAFNVEDGLYEVGVPGASIDVSDWSDLTEGAIVEGRITGANTGGLECMVNNIRGFIPSSQVGMYRVENFAEYIGQKLPCIVTEVNPKRRNLVLSHRALLERQREETRKQLLEQMQPGDVLEGVVRSIRDFGAFVDLGGVDGMVHVSQISWERVNHPSEVLKEGQKVRVKIEKLNAQTGKISLSIRDLLDRPWDSIEQKFPVGTTVKGPVTRIAKFGAFVKLTAGVEGLIHISEMAHQRIRAVSDVVQEGQEVEVKILSIDPGAQRIALSLKATLPPPEAPVEETREEESPRESAVRKRKAPLRGGFDHPTGGEQFGLKW